MNFIPYLFPIVGAAIGYFTNDIAIRMLFRPHRPIGIGQFKIQGLLPKRRNDIAESVAATVEKELISMQDLSGVLYDIDFSSVIDKIVDIHFDSANNKEKNEIFSKINLTINAFMRPRIKKSLNENKDELIHEFIQEIERNVDFKDIIVRNIEEYDLDQMEDIVKSVSSKELRHITIIGGVLGFLIGLIQMIIYLII
ncbi:MAG: DUF445 family protein [Candidatus Methanomarinus sp.]|uniref:DUF445 family protein n=1 Tax=Candidatus Methanomarinus sp. TaxID=3386244 RepID=A0AC61S9P5_9EURY|nr:MAG: DUF445 family protein [ANME-2 cluster archaeon]